MSGYGPIDDSIMYSVKSVIFFDGIEVDLESLSTELNNINIFPSSGTAKCGVRMATSEHAGIKADGNLGQRQALCLMYGQSECVLQR